jgi:hypothetical protein
MSSAAKPDPELLPIHRPRCPGCQTRMRTVSVSEGPAGFEHRTFECWKCGHVETRLLASDPFQAGSAAWINGELRPPR